MTKSIIRLILGALLGIAQSSLAQDLLEPDQAFAFSAEGRSDALVITWRIADDYYMYRDKFHVEMTEGAALLGEPVMPSGKMKHDEFFGEMEIYEGTVRFEVPVTRSDAAAPTTITIKAHGQGCNEPVGVCYPPIEKSATLELPPAAAPATTPSISSLDGLKAFLGVGNAEPEFLDPDQAFRFDLYAAGPTRLVARFAIEDGYYLYRDKVKIESAEAGVSVGDVVLPPGKEKHDEYFGRIEAYYQGFDAEVPLQRQDGAAGEAAFKVAYQGCADQGICYPPIEKSVTVSLPPLISDARAAPPAGPPAGPTDAAKKGFWALIATAFVTGILLTFTPCVLPMIPILSSIIVGEGDRLTKARGGTLALSYVGGTAVTYTAAGILAGASGEQLQAYFQNIWAIGAVSVILVLLALSMFGLYEIQMPAAIQSRLQGSTQNMRGGRMGVVFVLGLVSALIVGACVSPLLIVVLGVAIVKGDPVLGGAMMCAMALGMGVFLIALGLGAGYLLPRAGAWMDRVKQGFGVMLIGVAIYILGAIPQVPVLYLWAALFIVTAVYLGALQSLPEGANGWRYLWKGAGVFLLVWGVLALIGGMSGNRDVLRPIDFASSALLAHGGTSPGTHAAFVRVGTLSQLDAELDRARGDGKPAILDYYADWCVDCVRMEKATFQDTRVAELLNREFVLVQVDVTDPTNADTRAIKQRYGVFGPPAMLFFDARGQERQELRRYGFMAPNEFLDHIADI